MDGRAHSRLNRRPLAPYPPDEEGVALHRWLVDFVGRDEFCYYHRWRPRDLVMWDNRVLLHRAIEYDYARYRRVLRRTTVGGSTPIMSPFWPEARATAGGD